MRGDSRVARVLLTVGMVIGFLVLPGQAVQANVSGFATVWDTTKTSSSSSADNQIRLPLIVDGTYSFTVHWGDGNSDSITGWNQAEATHSYALPGTYHVTIDGILDGWNLSASGDVLKILEVQHWGGVKLGNAGYYFAGAENLRSTATDAPDLTDTTNLSGTFARAKNFDGPIGNWDTSNITSMSAMFNGAEAFNQPIGTWNTGKVTDMSSMFVGAKAFNQPIGTWNTSQVQTMSGMFQGALAFDRPLGAWDVSNVRNMSDMLWTTGLSESNYDELLNGWAALPTLQPNVTLGATVFYTAAAASSRAKLIDTWGWHVNDFGMKTPQFSLLPYPVPGGNYRGGEPIIFALTGVGTPRAFPLTVKNTGLAGLSFPAHAVTYTGADAGQFTVAADACSGTVVAPDATCDVTLAFSPTSDGLKEATVSFTSNAPTSPNQIVVRGKAGTSGISASRASLDMGTVVLPGFMATSVAFASTGSAPLIIDKSGVTIVGPDAADFSFEQGSSCQGAELVPADPVLGKASCQEVVRFAPTSPGPKVAALRVSSSAPGGPIEVALTGTGEANAVILKVSGKSFLIGWKGVAAAENYAVSVTTQRPPVTSVAALSSKKISKRVTVAGTKARIKVKLRDKSRYKVCVNAQGPGLPYLPTCVKGKYRKRK